MNIERDPIFSGVAVAMILAFFGVVGVKIKREFQRISNFFKRVWKMARGNGVSHAELTDAIAGLKNELRTIVIDATYPIQENSNGGNSLPDLINLVKDVRDEMRHNFEVAQNERINIAQIANRTEGSLNTHIQSKNAH